MSFILDALKKSESDRQRQSGPSLFEVKVAPPRRRLPVWAAAIAVLLGINIIVISWMLLRHPAAQQPAAASAPATVPAPISPRADAAAGNEAALAPKAATPASATAAPAAPREEPSVAASRGAAQGLDSGAGHPAAAPPAQAPAPPSTGADQSEGQPPAEDPSDYAPAVEPSAGQASRTSAGTAGGLPLYQQVVGSAGLPALHLDLHVYADSPKDRFVMINMHRLGEGDSLPSGVHVDAIRPDGAVLSYHGTRFLLPRD